MSAADPAPRLWRRLSSTKPVVSAEAARKASGASENDPVCSKQAKGSQTGSDSGEVQAIKAWRLPPPPAGSSTPPSARLLQRGADSLHSPPTLNELQPRRPPPPRPAGSELVDDLITLAEDVVPTQGSFFSGGPPVQPAAPLQLPPEQTQPYQFRRLA